MKRQKRLSTRIPKDELSLSDETTTLKIVQGKRKFSKNLIKKKKKFILSEYLENEKKLKDENIKDFSLPSIPTELLQEEEDTQVNLFIDVSELRKED